MMDESFIDGKRSLNGNGGAKNSGVPIDIISAGSCVNEPDPNCSNKAEEFGSGDIDGRALGGLGRRGFAAFKVHE